MLEKEKNNHVQNIQIKKAGWGYKTFFSSIFLLTCKWNMFFFCKTIRLFENFYVKITFQCENLLILYTLCVQETLGTEVYTKDCSNSASKTNIFDSYSIKKNYINLQRIIFCSSPSRTIFRFINHY